MGALPERARRALNRTLSGRDLTGPIGPFVEPLKKALEKVTSRVNVDKNTLVWARQLVQKVRIRSEL